MNSAIVVALLAIAATASETAAVRSCESACCASSCATTFPKCASKCCSQYITAADACDSCLTDAGCNPHPPTPTPPPSPAIGTWAELESACQKSGTYTLSSNFEMGSYTKEIHFGGKQLVIWGKNATLDAAGKGRVFSSTFGPNGDDDDHAKQDTSLELHNLVLQNGYADGGGAIYASGSGCIVEIHASSFISNFSPDGGGAIFARGNGGTVTVIISNTEFKSNTATDNGGAIYIDDGSLSISDTTFESNTSPYQGFGGAIYVFQNSLVHIESSQFVKGADSSATHNDIAQSGRNSTVKFFCPNGTTGTPFKMRRSELSVLELPPTKQVVSCK